MIRNKFVSKYTLALICSILFPSTLSGCWSSKEIEENALNIGLAIDKAENSELKDGEAPAIKVTYQYVNTTSLQSGGTGGTQPSYINKSESGITNHQIIREIALREEGPIMFQHTKVMIINGELIKENSLQEFLDFFLRDNEMRPSCLVLISNGPAKETLETNEKGQIPSFRLLGITDNQYRSSKLLAPVSLANLQGMMNSGMSYLLQNIGTKDGNIRFSGGAIMDGENNQLLGYLSERQLMGVNLISGDAKGGLIESYEPVTGKKFIFEIVELKSRIIPHIKNGNIMFEIQIKSEGRLSESWANSKVPEEEAKFRKLAEKAIQKEVEAILKETVSITQKEYSADVLGFGNALRIKDFQLWKQRKYHWDQLYPELPITYSIQMNISKYGLQKAK